MNKTNGYYASGKFAQRKRTFFSSAQGLSSNKVNTLLFDGENTLYAGTDKGLCRLENDRFVPVFKDVLAGNIASLSLMKDGCVAVCNENRLYKLCGGKLTLLRTFDDDVVEVTDKRGFLYILTKGRFICTDYECKTDDVNRSLEGGEGKCLAVNDTQVYAATQTNISVIHGKRKEWKNILPVFSSMPKSSIYSLCFDEAGYLWVGCDDGAVIHDNMNLWLNAENNRSLPKNPVYKIVTDKVGGRYFASDVGIIYQNKGSLKYFSAERWVPDNKVNDIAVSDDGKKVFAATDKGISLIETIEMSLKQKADYYEELVEKYHIRRGFTGNCDTKDGVELENTVEISDNDGLWTGSYVVAECYRYAATGDKEALEKARRGMNAMLLLTRITDISGFTARAVRYPGEPGFDDGHKEWVKTADGKCEWKCETSSDEMSGHFWGLSTYYDLCANDEEKEEIKVALCKIMDHIITNNYRLIDHDGLPTTWAAWTPELLNHDDKWYFERGINSFELLAFLKVSYHISGDEKYKTLYDSFVQNHHYALNAMQHKIRDAHICHIDDNLGFIVALTLLRLEENEALRSYYLCGLEDHWAYERVEKQPMFCFVHAAFTGRDEDLCEGVQSLREMPLDLNHYAMNNSKRKDIIYDTEQAEWFEDPLPKYCLPFDEKNVDRPDAGAFRLDWTDRHRSLEGTVFLLPYWIGRYYGLIKEIDE